MTSRLLSGFGVGQFLAGMAQANQRGTDADVAGPGVGSGVFDFFLTAGEFVAQGLQRHVLHASEDLPSGYTESRPKSWTLLRCGLILPSQSAVLCACREA